MLSSQDPNYTESTFHMRSVSASLLYVIYETTQVEQSTAGMPETEFPAYINFLDAEITQGGKARSSDMY